jgi:hypothetical protein
MAFSAEAEGGAPICSYLNLLVVPWQMFSFRCLVTVAFDGQKISVRSHSTGVKFRMQLIFLAVEKS